MRAGSYDPFHALFVLAVLVLVNQRWDITLCSLLIFNNDDDDDNFIVCYKFFGLFFWSQHEGGKEKIILMCDGKMRFLMQVGVNLNGQEVTSKVTAISTF